MASYPRPIPARAQIALSAKDRILGDLILENDRLQMQIGYLRAALEPFARNVTAVSLGEALGHIKREDLNHAIAAMRATDKGE
jgi:hypothetical protein